MITIERLEELIKQQATIYDIKTTKIMLDRYSHVYQDHLILGHPISGKYQFYLNNLFETEEQAEWAYMTVIERIERFEPPMWKDLLEKDLYVFTFVKDGEVYDFICNNYLEKVDIRLEQRLIGYSSKPVTTCQFNDATKENYIKACEVVRDLIYKEEK